MWVCAEAFHEPKKGLTEEQYEDAFFPEQVFRRDLRSFRCAVADGATESVFSREWALLLVRAFGRGKLRIKHLQQAWNRAVRDRSGSSGAWYVQQKKAAGAFAALIGLSFHDRSNGVPGGTWRALAVGDSCFFQVRNEKLVTSGPITNAADFGNNPYLVATNKMGPLKRGQPHVDVMSGTWECRDSFYLCSDALAQWICEEIAQGRPPWQLLREIGGEGVAPFPQIVTLLREKHGMKNDDTTLLRVEVA